MGVRVNEFISKLYHLKRKISGMYVYNLVEAHCYGIRKGSGHVLSNHVAVNE